MIFKDNLTNKVYHLLKDKELLRDDDQYLIAMIWRDDCERLNLEPDVKRSDYSLLGKLARHELTHFESIRRTRQKLQEEYPELRGKLYGKRHELKEEVKLEVREFNPQQTKLL